MVRVLRKTLVQGLLAASVLGISCISAYSAEMLSVVKDGVNLRSGPAQSYEVLFQLPVNYPLMVLTRKGDWIKVSDFEGDKGWIYKSMVNKSTHAVIKVQECNIRSGPGTNYDKVGTMTREVVVEKIDKQGEWVKIAHPQLTGWIHQNLIWP